MTVEGLGITWAKNEEDTIIAVKELEEINMKNILPSHYEITTGDNWIRCRSKIGLRTNNDGDDDEAWSYVFGAIKNKYKGFREVFHNTCAYYQDFTVYI